MQLKHDHSHNSHHESSKHTHVHGVMDPSLFDSENAIRILKKSFWILFVAASLQAIVVTMSGSVALLADTVHNFVDAATAIPLLIAFRYGKRKPNSRFTYGFGRVEDLAGLAIILIILFSAIFMVPEAWNRYLHPVNLSKPVILAFAAVIGFLANEWVAMIRISGGRTIGSAALVADGNHARADGLTSLAVLASAIGIWTGFPKLDPIVALIIILFIFRIVWQSAKAILPRMLDGVDPEIVREIIHSAKSVEGIENVSEVRVRWIGHRLHAELNVSVMPKLSVEQGHELARQVRHELLHSLTYLSNATIHVDPATASGEKHHSIQAHHHDGLGEHSH